MLKYLTLFYCDADGNSNMNDTSWQIDGETMETVIDFIWGGEGLENHCRWWLQPWN